MNEHNLERIIALLNTYPVPANVEVTAPDGYLYFALVNVTPLGTQDLIPPGSPVDMSKEHLKPDGIRAMLVRQGTLLAVTPAELAEATQIQMGRHRAALREAENEARIAQGLAPLSLSSPQGDIDEPEDEDRELSEDELTEIALDVLRPGWQDELPEPAPEPEPDTEAAPRRKRKSDIETEEN